MFTLEFWKAATERAIKTAAQAALLAIGGDAAFDAVNADWGIIGSFALGGAVLSYLFSMISAPFGNGVGPSLANETLLEVE